MAAGAWLALSIIVIGIGPWSAGEIQNRLQTQAEAELARRGMDWVQVEMDGQRATLRGAAPSDDDREAARAIVYASTWSGGVVAGGVTRVRDDMTNAHLERSFEFRADMARAGRVLVRGDATDDAAREGIRRFAENNFPNGADTDLTLSPGGATSEEWEEAAKRLLGQLARLDRGSVFLEGAQAGLVGEAANPQIARSVVSTLQTLPEPYRAAAMITPAGAPAEVRIEDEAACRAVIRAAHGTDDLRFDREADTPSPMTSTALRRMARVFAGCPDTLRLRVRIATSEGGPSLAERRVARVESLLSAGGLEAARIHVSVATNAVDLITFEIEEVEG